MSKPNLLRNYRFIVIYEGENGHGIRFVVWAATASVATSRTIIYIEDNDLNPSEQPYTLLPRISKDINIDYTIN